MSTDTKFTKGPWVYRAKLSGSENHKGFLVGIDGHCVLADVMPLDENGIDGEKVARLIAAAPDMYETLTELTSLMQDVIDGRYKPDSFTLQPSRDALAKARGEG